MPTILGRRTGVFGVRDRVEFVPGFTSTATAQLSGWYANWPGRVKENT